MTDWNRWIPYFAFERDEFIVFTMAPNQNEIKFIEIEIEINQYAIKLKEVM